MKKNIIFLSKIAIALALAIALLIPINLLYTYGETYGGTYAGMDKYENVPTGIEYANFGPSYGMNCFDYETLTAEGKTCFNFSLTMQDLYHDYEIYKAYEDHFAEGAVVAITVSYFSFCSETDSPSSARYYKILGKDAIKGYTLENDLSAKFFPVYGKGSSLIRDLTNDLLDSIMKKSIDTSNEPSAEDNAADTDSRTDELKKDSAVRVMTIESGNLTPYTDYIAENAAILEAWIKDMQDKGLKPVIVLTPYWTDYANGFNAELLERGFTAPLAEVVERTGVAYENFNTEQYTAYITNPSYFSNCDHVSKAGGKAFMELFLKCLP